VLGKAAKALFFWYFFNKEKVHVKQSITMCSLPLACVEEDFDTTSGPHQIHQTNGRPLSKKQKPLNHQSVKGFFVAPPGIEPGS
ncbi:MAG: hypothetical protein WA004_03985, partial [Saprospiraceae bacterium]